MMKMSRSRVRVFGLIAVMVLMFFGVLGTGASAQCIDDCENPNLIDHYTEFAGCRSCQVFSKYYTITETWKYSCSNGGTCTVRDTYDAPCDVCPW